MRDVLQPMTVGSIQATDLKSAADGIETVCRKLLKLGKSHETNLTKADFEYWLPQVVPFVPDEWRIEDYSTFYVEIASNPPNLEQIFTFFESGAIQAKPQVVCNFPDRSRLILIVGGSIAHPKDKCEIRFIHRQTKAIESLPKVVQCYRSVATAWDVEDSVIEDSFGVTIPEGAKSKFGTTDNWNPYPTPGVWTTPPSVSIHAGLQDFSRYRDLFLQTIEALVPISGPPRGSAFVISGDGDCIPEVVKIANEIAPVWDMTFFGQYKRKFNPYVEPNKNDRQRIYPVLCANHEINVADEVIDLQVNVRHRPGQPSDLVLYSERDFSFMEEVAAAAGLEVTELPRRFPNGT